MKHQYSEAFMLMTYKCESCGRTEKIWNSRDGVTPFIVICPNCKGFQKHVDWNQDEYKPNHVLSKGDRYFCTLTKEQYRKELESAVLNSPSEKAVFDTSLIKQLVDGYDENNGDPFTGVWNK